MTTVRKVNIIQLRMSFFLFPVCFRVLRKSKHGLYDDGVSVFLNGIMGGIGEYVGNREPYIIVANGAGERI